MNAAKQDMKFNFSKATVVVIDASVISQEVASNILQAFGFRNIIRCGDLLTANTTLQARKVDLVLLDPYAFGSEGYDFVRRLRADTQSINTLVPVVFVTAYTHIRSISEARGCGADYIVAKPYSTGSLLQRILWVASKAGHRSDLAVQQTVSQEGSGMELW